MEPEVLPHPVTLTQIETGLPRAWPALPGPVRGSSNDSPRGITNHPWSSREPAQTPWTCTLDVRGVLGGPPRR